MERISHPSVLSQMRLVEHPDQKKLLSNIGALTASFMTMRTFNHLQKRTNAHSLLIQHLRPPSPQQTHQNLPFGFYSHAPAAVTSVSSAVLVKPGEETQGYYKGASWTQLFHHISYGNPFEKHPARPTHIALVLAAINEKIIDPVCKTPQDAKDIVEVLCYIHHQMNSLSDKQQTQQLIKEAAAQYIIDFAKFYNITDPEFLLAGKIASASQPTKIINQPDDRVLTWLNGLDIKQKGFILPLINYIFSANRRSIEDIIKKMPSGNNLSEVLSQLVQKGIIHRDFCNGKVYFWPTDITKEVISHLEKNKLSSSAMTEEDKPKTPTCSAFGFTQEEYKKHPNLSTAMLYFSRNGKKQLQFAITLLTHIQAHGLQHSTPELYGMFSGKHTATAIVVRLKKMNENKIIKKVRQDGKFHYLPTNMTNLVIRGLKFRLNKKFNLS